VTRGAGEENVAECVADADAKDDPQVSSANPDRRSLHDHCDEDDQRSGEPEDQRSPESIGLSGCMHRREIETEADRGENREADAGGNVALAFLMLLRGEPDADQRAGDSRDLGGEGRSPVARPKTTGTIADAPAIGATTAMAPMAMPR
jgi:hypothetical protein